MRDRHIRGRRQGVFPLLALPLALVLATGACDTDELLDIYDPEFSNPEQLANPDNLPILVAGAIGDFHVAYSGAGGDAYLSVDAAMTDQMFSAGTFTTRTATDRREQQTPDNGNTSDGAYVNFHQARIALKRASTAVIEIEGATDPLVPLLKSLEGYTWVGLGEGWCGAVPFSDPFTNELGSPQSTSAIFNGAVTLFNEALAADASYNLAKVGKGRALLNLGQFAEAAAAVSGVPTTFAYYVEHSDNSGRQQNPMFGLQQNGRWSMSDAHNLCGPTQDPATCGGSTNAIDYLLPRDPRTPWYQDPGGGFDENYALFHNTLYNDYNAAMPVATGVEARLIEAEAQLNGGNIVGWLVTLNDLRLNVVANMTVLHPNYAASIALAEAESGVTWPQTLAPLLDPGTAAAREDLMMRERAFWLFNTSHRLGDLRRFIRDYGRSQADVFPSGSYYKGGTHGDDVNFPVDFDEGNNPNYDPAACDVDVA